MCPTVSVSDVAPAVLPFLNPFSYLFQKMDFKILIYKLFKKKQKKYTNMIYSEI